MHGNKVQKHLTGPFLVSFQCLDIWYLIFECPDIKNDCQPHHWSLKPSFCFAWKNESFGGAFGWAFQTRSMWQINGYDGTIIYKTVKSCNLEKLLNKTLCLQKKDTHKEKSKKVRRERLGFAIANLLESVQQDGHTERRKGDRVLLWVFFSSKMISHGGARGDYRVPWICNISSRSAHIILER